MYTRDKFTGRRILKSGLKLIGGKTKVRDILYQFFPEHKNYFEPFSGTFSLVIGKERSEVEIVNDISVLHLVIANFRDNHEQFWQLLQPYLEKLYRFGKDDVEWGRKNFNEWKIGTTTIQEQPILNVLYYLINKHCFNGIIRFNKDKICNSSYGKEINGRGVFTKKWLDAVNDRLQGVTITGHDFHYFFDYYFVNHRVRWDTQDTFIFLDPPYRKKEFTDDDKGCVTDYNGEVFTDEQHQDLCNYLKSLKQTKWLMTINDDEWVRELYKDFNIVSHDVFYSCSNTKDGRGKRPELLIANYPIQDKAKELQYILEAKVDKTKSKTDNKRMEPLQD